VLQMISSSSVLTKVDEVYRKEGGEEYFNKTVEKYIKLYSIKSKQKSQGQIIRINQNQLIFKNFADSKYSLFYHILKNFNFWQNVQIIDISGSRIQKSIINMLLNLVTLYCYNLTKINFSGHKANLKLSMGIQVICKNNPIKIIKMNSMGLTSKQFCTIAVGISEC